MALFVVDISIPIQAKNLEEADKITGELFNLMTEAFKNKMLSIREQSNGVSGPYELRLGQPYKDE